MTTPRQAQTTPWTLNHGTTSPVTGAAPSAVTDGMDISSLRSWVLTVSCPASQTLSAAGAIRIWRLNTALGRWARAPELDLDLTQLAAGVSRDASTSDREVALPYGRVYAQPDGATFSGGSTGLDTRIDAWTD